VADRSKAHRAVDFKVMSDPHWENLKEIFHAAVALAPHERAAYLDRACDGNLSLQEAVESLIKSHEETSNFVDMPAYQAAAKMLVAGLEFKSGQTLAHYKLLSPLGEGGMGKVYLAEDTKLHRKVALKFLTRSFTKDQERLHRFEQEARAASALNHPNILTIHEIGEVEGHRFISTEFIEGQTLRERLRSSLELDDALDIAIQVASALVAAHRDNIVHRDIKPENIMIRRYDGLVKVLDFGLAKMSVPRGVANGSIDREAETLIRANTAPGVVMGTVAYMSPEQARGDTVDERTDIWSLGVVLYEMIAGCSPFAAGTSNEVISAILSKEKPSPLVRYSRLVPERLEEIVEKALTKNRDERYQTSKDLWIDLKRLKQSLELKAGTERSTSSEQFVVTASSGQSSDGTPSLTKGATLNTQPASSAEYIVNQIKSHKRGVMATLLVLLFAVATSALIYGWRLKHTAVPAQPEIKSLAVLPLKSLDTGEDYLGVGITDAVIRRISQTGQLTVRPTSAVLKYVKEDTDSLVAARQLSADAILEGTVQRAGVRLRVTVNLLRTSDGASLYADNFDLTTADVFAIQDKVAQQVASRLQVSFDAAQQARLNQKYPTDPKAYESYIRGVTSLDERGYDREAMPQMNDTIDFLKKAIEIDPKYALAHAQLGFAYAWTAIFIEPGEARWAGLARVEIKQSTELDPNLAETHIAHALLLWSSYDGYQNAEAIRELRLAKQLNPNISSPALPTLYGHVGLDDLASKELNRALEINPTSQSLKTLSFILPYLRGDVDGWFAEHQQIGDTQLYDAPFAPWYFLRKGRLDDAKRVIDERLSKGWSDANELLMWQAQLLALKGDFSAAQAKVPGILAKVQPGDEGHHHSTYDAACIYALSGHSSEAVRWLQETAATGFPNYPLFARDTFLDRIRQSPDFQKFIAEQKAQWERYRQEFD
jgi:eukaryotic-like serine/threonine-protein kinase